MKKSFQLAFAGLLLASPLLAQAEGSGFYIGGGIGGASYSDSMKHQVESAYHDTAYHVDDAGLSDDSDTSYKIFAGYRFLPWLAVEAGWTDLGNAESFYQLTKLPKTPDIAGHYDLRGITAALAAEFPLGDQFGIGARAGFIFSRLKYEESGSLRGNGIEPYTFVADDEHQTRPLLGLGFSWKPQAQWEVRLDWDRYLGIGTRFDLTEEENGRFDHVDQYTVNLLYRFGE